MYKKIFRIFFIVVFISVFFYLTYYLSSSQNLAELSKDLGEKMFLKYHKNDLAIKILEFSKEKNDRDFETYFLLGRIYFVQGKMYESITNFTEAINLNPDYKTSYYGRGLTYGFASPLYYKDAENDFKKYIEIDNYEFEKTGRHAYGAWAGYNDLSWIYFLQGDFKNAESAARLGLALTPENPWLLNSLGTALISEKKCEEAYEAFKKAEELIQKTTVKQFGEAYSGDHPDSWIIGKKQMEEVIKENKELCAAELRI